MKHNKVFFIIATLLIVCIAGVFIVVSVRKDAADSAGIKTRTESDAKVIEADDDIPDNEAADADKDTDINKDTENAEDLLLEGKLISDYYITNTGNPENLYHIDEDGVLFGAGRNNCGQLGQGNQDYDFHDDFVRIADNVVHVDFSPMGYAVYLTNDGCLYGIGNISAGLLGDGRSFDDTAFVNPEENIASTPILLMDNVIYARCGRYDIACIDRNNCLWIWGTIAYSRGKAYYVESPQKVMDDVVFITGGIYNHAALASDGSVWTWGYNYTGNCGVDDKTIVETPTKVAEDVVMIWTGSLTFGIEERRFDDFGDIYPRGMENTVIEKSDNTLLICGEGVGHEEKYLDEYYETGGISMICTSEFVPYVN